MEKGKYSKRTNEVEGRQSKRRIRESTAQGVNSMWAKPIKPGATHSTLVKFRVVSAAKPVGAYEIS